MHVRKLSTMTPPSTSLDSRFPAKQGGAWKINHQILFIPPEFLISAGLLPKRRLRLYQIVTRWRKLLYLLYYASASGLGACVHKVGVVNIVSRSQTLTRKAGESLVTLAY